MKNCKTCKFLGVIPDARGRIVVRKHSVWPCKAPDPELPRLPSSMMKRHLWHWPPQRSYMQGDEGTDCATYEDRNA